MAREYTYIDAAGIEVRISSPGKVFFPAGNPGGPAKDITKLDLIAYYLACADATVNGLRDRPTVLKRWKDGVTGDFFFQKRVPEKRPDWLQTATVTFPSGRSATELVPNDAAHLVWGVNLGNLDWNPWPVRRDDLDHTDELRIDLDPEPGIAWDEVRQVALTVRDVLEEHGLRGFPKTSGSRGIHVFVRITPTFDFLQVRRAALAVAREVERRMPGRATSKWWKEAREGVFLDYNQNARDRTIASAYSVRPKAHAPVSMPLRWDELDDVTPFDFTVRTAGPRFAELGDLHAGIDETSYSLEPFLAWYDRDETEGLSDMPYPPDYPKMKGEPKRVQPSRDRDRAGGVEGDESVSPSG